MEAQIDAVRREMRGGELVPLKHTRDLVPRGCPPPSPPPRPAASRSSATASAAAEVGACRPRAG